MNVGMASALGLVLALVSGCSMQTLFQSNFSANPVNQRPAQTQAIGTVNVDGPPGSVLVVPNPNGGAGKWVRIRRPDGPNLAALQGNLSPFRGDGYYVFTAHLYMPAGSGTASIQFERVGQSPSDYFGFLHLDFLPGNAVRIDDNPATDFGSFSRNKPFIVEVILDIGATQATAHVVLAGDGASGQRDYVIPTPFLGPARQFGAVRIWQGFPHTGPFHVDAIVVNRRN